MRHNPLFLIGLICLLFPLSALAQDAATPIAQPEPRPLPSTLQAEQDLQLEAYFPSLAQGGVGLLRLIGEGIMGARWRFLDEEGDFFQIEGDAHYALLRAGMDAPPRKADLIVHIDQGRGSVSMGRELRIDAARYIRQDFAIPADRARLVDAALERGELETLAALTATVTPEPLWDVQGFSLPLASALTSPFGAYRRLNEDTETRHTGWDQRAPLGTPVPAMASGRVAYADKLSLRGNYVLIDHGLGLYSGYAHLSALHVQPGDEVAAGQIIGDSGNSGRSSGPHLHWEARLRGRWVDGLALVKMWLPA